MNGREKYVIIYLRVNILILKGGGKVLIYYIKDILLFFGTILKEYWYWIIIIIALCVLIPLLIKCFRALFSRIAFVLKLSALCRKKGAILKYKKCPILSLLKNHTSYDFCITVPHGDKDYSVKFFPKNPSKKNILLNESKKVYISKITFQTYIGQKGAIPGGNPTTLNYSETNPREVILSLPEPSNQAQSVLLFQPSPHNISVSGCNDYQKTDDKMNYHGYRIFEGKEFIKYLSRTI